jgi:lambda family phage portal protein
MNTPVSTARKSRYGGGGTNVTVIPGTNALAVEAPSFAPSYTAASLSHADMRNWYPNSGSPDADVLPGQAIIRARARDLTRNHGVASGAQQTLVDNVLGVGLWCTPIPDYVRLGRDRTWASEWRKQVKSLWREYSETTACDAGECLTLDGLANQIFRGAWANGDGLALPLWLPPQGLAPVSTRLQVIESDRLSNPNYQIDTPNLRGGIEIDEYGAPQAYWIRNAHPGDRFLLYGGQLFWTWERIPAKTGWGRKRVIHLHDKERAGQTRGVPALAAVMRQFKVLGDYQNAELKAATVNAMVSLITESAVGQESIVELLSGNPQALKAYQDGLSGDSRSAIPFSEGMVLPLNLGEKAYGFTPARPTTAYDPFVTAVFRHIGVGLNIPYETLMKDFSKTNYSSARASLLEAWRFFTGRRNIMGLQFYQPVYELWLEEMVNAGKIEAPKFYENRAAWCRATWIGPGRGWVDPMKEAEAAGVRLMNGLSSYQDECAEQGKDWEDQLEQIAEERDRLKSLKLDFIFTGSKKAQTSGSIDPATGEMQDPINPDNAAAAKNAVAIAEVRGELHGMQAVLQIPPSAIQIDNHIAAPVIPAAQVVVQQPRKTRELFKRDANNELLEIVRIAED